MISNILEKLWHWHHFNYSSTIVDIEPGACSSGVPSSLLASGYPTAAVQEQSQILNFERAKKHIVLLSIKMLSLYNHSRLFVVFQNQN